MTQVFADDGNQVPVTVIQAGPCTVVGVRTRDSHGYDALQLGFEARKKNVTKPMAGHFKKANVEPMRIVREIRLDKAETLQGYQVGQAVTAELFKPGELVDVVGVTKGKGFQGGVRRYGPGHHLPGRMGGERRTVLNVSVVRVLPEQSLLLLRGAVPGANGSLVMIRKSVKITKAQQQQKTEKK